MKRETDFQKRVCEVVRKIKRGQVLTYKEVAKKVGSPFAWRAVGNILSENKNSKIPCHRVIRSDGKIGGYKEGQKKKIALLRREGIQLK